MKQLKTVELRIGMRVKGYGEPSGDLLYTGKVSVASNGTFSAAIQRDDRKKGIKWFVWRKADGSWGADCSRGRLVIADELLPWET